MSSGANYARKKNPRQTIKLKWNKQEFEVDIESSCVEVRSAAARTRKDEYINTGGSVCVGVPSGITRFRSDCSVVTFSAGGSSPLMSLLPTKLLMSWEDIGADHSDVPASL